MPVSLDESSLIEVLHYQDRDTFNNLYDCYSAAVFGEILRFVKTRNVAEELLQEVFIAIWKKRNQHDPDKCRIFTWMISITRAMCIDHLRKIEQTTDRAREMNVIKGFQQSI